MFCFWLEGSFTYHKAFSWDFSIILFDLITSFYLFFSHGTVVSAVNKNHPAEMD
jgi:hypothetical protein